MLNATKQAFYIFVSLLFFMPKLIKQNTFVNGEEIHLEHQCEHNVGSDCGDFEPVWWEGFHLVVKYPISFKHLIAKCNNKTDDEQDDSCNT